MNKISNTFISNHACFLHMTEVVSKCFRCNLVFRDESLAALHREIMNHSTTRVRVQATPASQ